MNAEMSENPNQKLLNEVNTANLWFHARKTKPIWAREAVQDEMVETLEGTEAIKAGEFLCRGIAGEVWPQSAERLASKYDATDEVDDDGWRKYAPKPDTAGVMATCIKHNFSVTAKWGTLTGKPGDYLVKDFTDRDVDFPDDVWVVDGELFDATYEVVTQGGT